MHLMDHRVEPGSNGRLRGERVGRARNVGEDMAIAPLFSDEGCGVVLAWGRALAKDPEWRLGCMGDPDTRIVMTLGQAKRLSAQLLAVVADIRKGREP